MHVSYGSTIGIQFCLVNHMENIQNVQLIASDVSNWCIPFSVPIPWTLTNQLQFWGNTGRLYNFWQKQLLALFYTKMSHKTEIRQQFCNLNKFGQQLTTLSINFHVKTKSTRRLVDNLQDLARLTKVPPPLKCTVCLLRLNSMFWVPAKCASKINLETG